VTSATLAQGTPHDPSRLIGMGALVGLAYRQGDIGGVWNRLLLRYAENPADAAALLDMSVILQTTGHRDKGLDIQRHALGLSRLFQRVHGRGDGLKVLVFMAEGDFMANTPVDFLMEGSNATLWIFYVDGETRELPNLPEHDVAFVAIGESDAAIPALENLNRLLQGWRGPIVNGAPKRILALTRDGVAAICAGEESIVSPPTARVDRPGLAKLARGEIALTDVLPEASFPITVRPFGSHAGEGLEKIDSAEGLAAYLESRSEQRFYISPFIDYSGPDGLFRKQRIAIIDGHPYPGHWATSRHWMVHYLNSGMLENEAWRVEEAAWMRDFDTDYALRHAAAFEALTRKLGLDYFVIDCAETKDGRLLLFEAHVAMILHAMDPADIFPYKAPAMQRLFAAFQTALQRRCKPAPAESRKAAARP
jgi:hypothetical protein